jgi:hypothetical protein
MENSNTVINTNDLCALAFEYDYAEDMANVKLLDTEEKQMKTLEKLNAQERKQLSEYEDCIDENLDGFYAVGGALSQINHLRLYRETHPSFAEYVRKKFGFSASHAYRLITANKIAENIKASPIGEGIKPIESQVRELVGLDPKQQVEVFAAAQEENGDKNPTAKTIAKAREQVVGAKPTCPKKSKMKGKNAQSAAKPTPDSKQGASDESKNMKPVDQIRDYLEKSIVLVEKEELPEKKRILDQIRFALTILNKASITKETEDND